MLYPLSYGGDNGWELTRLAGETSHERRQPCYGKNVKTSDTRR